jgi:hypothetical protein
MIVFWGNVEIKKLLGLVPKNTRTALFISSCKSFGLNDSLLQILLNSVYVYCTKPLFLFYFSELSTSLRMQKQKVCSTIQAL